MGYSITTPIKSQKAKAEMFAFLTEHFVPFYELLPHLYGGFSQLRGPLDGDFAYDHGKCRIGFDYSVIQDLERDYVSGLLHWMALRVGRKRKLPIFERFSNTKAIVPYIVYDGYESWPVRLASEWRDKAPPEVRQWRFCDEHGFFVPRKRQLYFTTLTHGRLVFKGYRKIWDELKRLSKLWDEVQNAN